MGGSSSSSGSTKLTIRYAPYIETQHKNFLNLTAVYRVLATENSPFVNYENIDINSSFFGLGYAISNFPAIYDMFGKHMAGLNIENIWHKSFDNVVDETNTNAIITEKIKAIDDDIQKDLTKIQTGMRDLNAVNTTSFVISKSMIENKRVKEFAKISLETKANLLTEAESKYIASLNTEKQTITAYAQNMKNYFMFADTINDINYNFASRNALWPFTSLSFEGAALGSLQGTVAWNKQLSPRERSTVSSVLLVSSYGATGASIGSSILPGWGTAIGAAVGAVVGIAALLLE